MIFRLIFQYLRKWKLRRNFLLTPFHFSKALLSHRGDTVSIPTYLVKNRFGIYAYRLITPRAVRQCFPSFKAEVRMTTRSRSVRQASRIAAYFHHSYQTLFEHIKQQGQLMDDWLDVDDTSVISLPLEAKEHIEQLTYARMLLSLLQRKNEIENLCLIYSNFLGEPVDISDFKLNTAQEVERFTSIAQLFATEDVAAPEAYFEQLSLKPKAQRKKKRDEPLKSVSVGSFSRTASPQPAPQPFYEMCSDEDIRRANRYQREQSLNLVLDVLKRSKAGKTVSIVIHQGSEQITLGDVAIENEDDLLTLSTMLTSYTPSPT